MPHPPPPLARVHLDLSDPGAPPIPLEQDLSAAARIGDTLFVACDETASIERLLRLPDGSWGAHSHLRLTSFLDLPGGPLVEADIEGLAIHDDWLWLTGSHALKRKRPKDDPDRLTVIERDANRFLLARLPLVEEAPGCFRPVRQDGRRRAQRLGAGKKRSKLIDWLEDDPVLAPFLSIPSKENGFDVEGIAVAGMKVWIGLRGPIIRGHAVVIELELKETGQERLKAKRLDGDNRYRCHFLDARGLGVRDLVVDGRDLLVLVGTSLSSDGPARVLRWFDGTLDRGPAIVPASRLRTLAELPYRMEIDHPEAIVPWPDFGQPALLVIYDAPGESRLRSSGVLADVYGLAEARAGAAG